MQAVGKPVGLTGLDSCGVAEAKAAHQNPRGPGSTQITGHKKREPPKQNSASISKTDR